MLRSGSVLGPSRSGALRPPGPVAAPLVPRSALLPAPVPARRAFGRPQLRKRLGPARPRLLRRCRELGHLLVTYGAKGFVPALFRVRFGACLHAVVVACAARCRVCGCRKGVRRLAVQGVGARVPPDDLEAQSSEAGSSSRVICLSDSAVIFWPAHCNAAIPARSRSRVRSARSLARRFR
jgi:hypothetical protein